MKLRTTTKKSLFSKSIIAGSFALSALLLLAIKCTPTVSTTEVITSAPTDNFGPSVTQGQQLTSADLLNANPKIPVDIYRDQTDGSIPPNHEDLATFAWLEFINLAAKSGTVRGEAGGSFAQTGIQPNQTLNLQTFHHRTELFPYRPKGQPMPPAPWNSTPSYQMFYKDSLGNTVPYNIPFQNYANLDEASQIAENLLFFPAVPNTMDPLNDYQALYEAKVNRVSWKYVNDNYTTLNNINPTSFPDGITLPDGTVHIKATWRPLASISTNKRYKYFTTDGIYYTGEDSAPVAKIGTFALVSLHVIHKTPNYPTFIFATFEHEDNLAGGTYYVPTYDIIDIALPDSVPTYSGDSLYSPNPYPADYTTYPYAEPNGVRMPIPNIDVQTIPGAKKIPMPDGEFVSAVPVTQPPTTNQMVADVNSRALALMQGLHGFDQNFIWQYYFLKGVQAVPTNDDTTPDFYLASDVTESSAPGLQLFKGGQNISFGSTGQPIQNRRNELNVIDLRQGGEYFSMGGCQGCHGISNRLNGFDFSFLYFNANSGYNPDVIGIKEREEIHSLVAKYNLSERRMIQTSH